MLFFYAGYFGTVGAPVLTQADGVLALRDLVVLALPTRAETAAVRAVKLVDALLDPAMR